MKTIEELLRNLARPEVLEFALASDRLPCVKVGGSFQPVDGAAPTTDAILQMLVGVGGSRYVESLTAKPTQWTTRVDGLGVITVSAIMRNDVVQARFTLTKREIPAAQARPLPPSVSKDTVTVTPTARQEVSAAKRDPRRDQTEPPPPMPGPQVRPPHADDDDEPTLMNQPPSTPQAAPSRPRLEVPLEIELDDGDRKPAAAAPPPAAGPPPRPPPPTPLDDDEATAEIDIPGGGGPGPHGMHGPPPVVVVNHGAQPQHLVQQMPPSTQPQNRAPSEGKVSTATQPMSAGPGTAKAPPPSAMLKDGKETVRGLGLGDDRKAEPAQPAPPPKSAPQVAAAPAAPPPASGSTQAAKPVPAKPAPSPQPAPVAAKTAVPLVPTNLSISAAKADRDRKEDPSTPSISISIAETAFIHKGPVPSLQPSTGMGLDELLGLARNAGASDLHVAAGRSALLRIAGELMPRTAPFDAAVVEKVADEIVPRRIHKNLDVDGACDFALDHATHGRFRVNVSRQRTGIKVCFRVIAREVPTLASLGLPETISQVTKHHQGLILLTGPSGHGKTSTLAALVDLVNRDGSLHIITVEDPIEYLHPRKSALLSQREVGTHTASFATALKAALREDPDVIVVGELRDAETVRMALSASETGHLVLGTMSSPSAAKTIDRVIDLFPPAEQQQVRMTLAGALRLIVSQRLVPSVDKTRLHVAVDVLPGSVQLYTLIRDDKTFQIPSLQQRGKAHGIVRMDDSLADLVRAGKVEQATARLMAEAPDDFDALLVRGAQPAPAPAPGGMLPKKRPPEETAMDLGGLLSKAGSLFGKKG